jgi:methanogenic corrinoid protein MtbC1
MEPKHAYHLLEQLIIKHGEQRHMDALKTLQDQMEKGYTVVGFYRDNDQPWVGYVEEASDTMDAARQAILSTKAIRMPKATRRRGEID